MREVRRHPVTGKPTDITRRVLSRAILAALSLPAGHHGSFWTPR